MSFGSDTVLLPRWGSGETVVTFELRTGLLVGRWLVRQAEPGEGAANAEDIAAGHARPSRAYWVEHVDCDIGCDFVSVEHALRFADQVSLRCCSELSLLSNSRFTAAIDNTLQHWLYLCWQSGRCVGYRQAQRAERRAAARAAH